MAHQEMEKETVERGKRGQTVSEVESQEEKEQKRRRNCAKRGCAITWRIFSAWSQGRNEIVERQKGYENCCEEMGNKISG